MIEVYFISKKNDKLRGFVDNRVFLNKNKKIGNRGCHVDYNTVYFQNSRPIMKLTENGQIIDMESGEQLGYINNFQIYDSEGQPYYQLSKKDGIVYLLFDENKPWMRLIGNLAQFEEITFLGFCFYFLDIFC